MKTSEFKKRVEELGYKVVEHKDEYQVWEDEYRFNSEARIFKGTERIIMLHTNNYTLIKLCIEYAETPLSEREDEKKYTVLVPDPEKRGKHVLALGRLVERKGEVIIMRVKKETLNSDRCQLTQAEIKRNHEYLWQFAKEVAT